MTGLFPMTSLELRPVRHVIPAGAELWRVHNTRYAPHEFNPNLADPFEFTDGNRFDGTPLDPYHCLYLADTATTALAESVLRSRRFEQPAGRRRIPYATVVRRSLSVLRTRCDLTLVSLIEAKDLAAVCQESTLLEDERNYVSARRWASEIRAQASDVMGADLAVPAQPAAVCPGAVPRPVPALRRQTAGRGGRLGDRGTRLRRGDRPGEPVSSTCGPTSLNPWDQAVEDVDDELGRGAWLRTRLVSRRSAPCAYQVTDAQRWLGPPVSRCLR
ncbi:RES family NAD+ phosphorylase [Streptomyces sp. GS7]|uniref:RES family NAD+ phosphorylase n=1 Tax=Streptomyces sp. GS7 TaxID=2692234 RepID=UPI001F2943D5|nr:RES family NAD+ phosphorylase [Streptomyces sp. GS7]